MTFKYLQFVTFCTYNHKTRKVHSTEIEKNDFVFLDLKVFRYANSSADQFNSSFACIKFEVFSDYSTDYFVYYYT